MYELVVPYLSLFFSASLNTPYSMSETAYRTLPDSGYIPIENIAQQLMLKRKLYFYENTCLVIKQNMHKLFDSCSYCSDM